MGLSLLQTSVSPLSYQAFSTSRRVAVAAESSAKTRMKPVVVKICQKFATDSFICRVQVEAAPVTKFVRSQGPVLILYGRPVSFFSWFTYCEVRLSGLKVRLKCE